ncbi:MAG: ABC transporter ATP-binding protein [Desulfuromonadia bacterium]
MSHHYVEIRHLSHTYPDGTVALRDISLRITHGESVGIIGHNGAGKSTLLLHLNGIIMPKEGVVTIGGIPLTRATVDQIRRCVGFVFQDPDDQLFMPTVIEDVAFGPMNAGLTPREAIRRAEDALDRVGLLHLRNRSPWHLSGGEKKRAAIATVLSLFPDILVLDEPTSGLDPFARRQLIRLLGEFTHTKIVATHDLDMVMELCSRVLILHEGEVRADAPPGEIFRDRELLASCHLEQPLSMQRCPVCGGGGD